MAEKRLNTQNLVAIICAAILVGTEIIAAALALGWAVGGLSGWGKEFTYGLIGLCFVAGCYATYRFVIGAIKAEPIYH
jgi:hypothetical protein